MQAALLRDGVSRGVTLAIKRARVTGAQSKGRVVLMETCEDSRVRVSPPASAVVPEEHETLRRQAAELGLDYQPVAGDGNCGPRCVAELVYGDQRKHVQVRTGQWSAARWLVHLRNT